MKRRLRRSRGTALGFALILLGVVAAAITALTFAFAAEARRTRSAVIGPQQRQLLLAATFLAADELQSHGTQPRQLALATPLPTATLTLTVNPPADSGAATLTILCDYRGTQAGETLIYKQKNGAWLLVGTTLRQNP
jgi:hypothetical protein